MISTNNDTLDSSYRLMGANRRFACDQPVSVVFMIVSGFTKNVPSIRET